MSSSHQFRARTRLFLGPILVGLLLSGCGAAPASGPPPTPRPETTLRAAVTPRPTWTPSYRPLPQITPAPTWTPGEVNLPAASFGFIFTYGACLPSRADSFAGAFSRAGTGVDPAVTVPLSLLPEDIQRIQRDIDQINFFSYPADFTLASPRGGALRSMAARTVTTFTPSEYYAFAVREGARQHTVRWQDNVLGV
ncbi:MAG TPA: hypothetical protein VGP33_02205, partial [Chloroflexota bacterium]|nr:hypothetical protein [Chloroflexota bacterium]